MYNNKRFCQYFGISTISVSYFATMLLIKDFGGATGSELMGSVFLTFEFSRRFCQTTLRRGLNFSFLAFSFCCFSCIGSLSFVGGDREVIK